ncbi:hypothetical protein H632_c3136p0, partial [Helicosporidium sp. ATCC 50920]
PSSGSGSRPGGVAIQVHLVMQYCDRGTLDSAIREGVFLNPQTGRPRLLWILLTARDVARGLEYLHDSPRRMVHRDLSAANVLLASAEAGRVDAWRHPADDRGFSALLSDFGLATAVNSNATHRTSHMRGTVPFMSPEVFETNDITPALDVYSLGVLLFMLYAGRLPYGKASPAQIILEKVRSASELEGPGWDLDAECPREFRALIADCTRSQRRLRETAANVRRRLERMVDRVWEEEGGGVGS